MIGNKIIRQDLQQIIETPIDWGRFSGKTVLITGANGFLPSYMVETLLFLNDEKITKDIKILALVRNLNKAKLRFKDYELNENLEFIVQDVCDPFTIDRKVNFIIHAASQASPKYFGIDPVGTLEANTIGTFNVLKLAKRQSIEAFLYFSSSEIYGILDENSIPIKENDYGYLDPTNVRSCYAESKRMGETICVSFLHQYGIPIKIIRPFHTYGPGMSLSDGRIYADFVSDIVNNRNLAIRSDGSARRAFCYLSDATVAFFLVLLNGANGEAYNVGNPNCEASVLELAQVLVKLFPFKGLKILRDERLELGYLKSPITRTCPDISNIGKLGWAPKIDIKEGFLRTILSYE